MMAHPDPQVGAALRRAAQADDRESLWGALEPLISRLGSDAALAAVWAEALRTTPGRRTLTEEASTILEQWPRDPALVGATADALVRLAERRPIDEPPLSEGPASTAASALDRCLVGLAPAERDDPEIAGRLWALRGNALRLLGPKRHADALAALERALALDPQRGAWHADVALLHKHARDFPRALEASRRARGLLGDHRGVLWNLAIAATATGAGQEAADAWRALGIAARAEASGLPFVEGLEPVQVRLPTLGAGHTLAPVVPDEAAGFEVVWAQPLSPCHGVIRTPTFREAIADFGDVVLWDGAPATVVERDGRPVPRFPLLGVLKAGEERRFRFLALQQKADDVARLGESLPDDVVLYQHGERVETVCPRCAAGQTLVRHEHLPAEEHRIAFGKLVVPASHDLAAFERALEDARRAHPGVRMAVPALYETLGDTKRAGAHHKRWGEIERTAAGPA